MSVTSCEATPARARQCPLCGDDLLGMPDAHRCPECGFVDDAATVIWRPRRP